MKTADTRIGTRVAIQRIEIRARRHALAPAQERDGVIGGQPGVRVVVVDAAMIGGQQEGRVPEP